MPWIGPTDAVMKFLADTGADQGEDGSFIISGEPVTSGIGGDELVVPDGTVYFIKRRPLNLAAAMKGTGEGFGGFRLLEHGPGYSPNPAPGGWKKYQETVVDRIVDLGEPYGHYRELEQLRLLEGTGTADDEQGPARDRLRAYYEAGVPPRDAAALIFAAKTGRTPNPNPKGAPAIWKTVVVSLIGPSVNVPIHIWRGRGVPTEKDFLDAPPFTIFPSHTNLGRRRLPRGEAIKFPEGGSEMAWWSGEHDPKYDENVQGVLERAGLTGPDEYLTEIIDTPDDMQGQRFDWGRGRIKLKGPYQAYPWAVERGYTLIKVPDALKGKNAKYAQVFVLDEERSRGDTFFMVQTPRREEFATAATSLGTARRRAREDASHKVNPCFGLHVHGDQVVPVLSALGGRRGNPGSQDDAQAVIRRFMGERGFAEEVGETQFFEGPTGELIVRVKYPGSFYTLLHQGGAEADALKAMLREIGWAGWVHRKGKKGKFRAFNFRPAPSKNPRGWTLATATYLAMEIAGRLIEGERAELASGEPLTPVAAGNLLLAYGYLYQARFIALALGAAELAAQMGDAMEGIVAALGAGCGVVGTRGAGGARRPAAPNPDSMVLELDVLNAAARDAASDLEKVKDESRSLRDRFPVFMNGIGSATIAAAAAHDRGNLELRDQMEGVKEEFLQTFGQACATENLKRIEAGTAGGFSRRWGGAKKKKGKKKKPNPTPERHRRAYNAYIHSAGTHLQRGAELLEKGQRVPAFKALRHAECDIRQAYTEAFYAKKDDKELTKMTTPLESLYQGIQGQMRELETRL